MGLVILEAANNQIKVFVREEDRLSYKQGSGNNYEGENNSDYLGAFCLLEIGYGRANINSGNTRSME